MQKVISTHSVEETKAVGYELAKQANPGEVYALLGDLGAGKTAFAGGFAEGLGITEPITSPTFTILMVYEEGRMPFYHMDVYRIDDPEEMYEIGFDELIGGDGVCLIEWASQIEELLPEETIPVLIERDNKQGFDYRKITIGKEQA